MEELIALDKRLFIYLNHLHTSWLDPVMFWMSATYSWIPLYLFLLFVIIKKYRSKTWIVILSIAFTIALSDQIASALLKPLFMRLRPSHEPAFENVIHYVNNYRGGLYGFASSHASNVFALATFFWLLFRLEYKSSIWLFAWATIVAYTRIYLGVHYPGDVLTGAVIGVLSGWLGFKICTWLFLRTENKSSGTINSKL